VCKQYPHHVEIDFLSTTCWVHTHFTPLHYTPCTQFTFLQANNLCYYWTFFLYDLPRVKTLCDLKSSYCYRAPPPSHTYENQTQKKKKKKKKKNTKNKKSKHNTNGKRKKTRTWENGEMKSGRIQESERKWWMEKGKQEGGEKEGGKG